MTIHNYWIRDEKDYMLMEYITTHSELAREFFADDEYEVIPLS